MRSAGERGAGRRRSGENEKKRVCFHRSFRLPVCLSLSCLRSRLWYSLLSHSVRLVPRLVLFVLPDRLVSCLLISFPLRGVSLCRLVLSRLVIASRRLASAHLPSFHRSFRSSSSLSSLSSSFVSLPLLPLLAFSFSSSVSPRLAFHAPLAFPIAVLSMSHMKQPTPTMSR